MTSENQIPRSDARPRLFVPGPTEVDASVLKAMSSPPIGHRTDTIRELIADLQSGLQRLLSTQQPVLLMTCSATGVMEGSLRSLVPSRGRVLHLVAGAFGAKWAGISRSLGFESIVEEVPWGAGFEIARLEAVLKQNTFDAVCLTHNETSTGAFQHDLAEFARVVRERSDALLLVDAVSSLSATEVCFDEWGLDVVLAGVQKAFALPPGLAVAAVSARAYERGESVAERGTYLDLLVHRDRLRTYETPSTPSTAHLYALRRQLERIHAEGAENRYQRHQTMALRAQEWARSRFELFTESAFLSPTVTCVQVDAGFDVAGLRAAVRARGFELGGGYGKLKPSTFRIGHMGEHDLGSLNELLATIDDARSGEG